MRNASEVAVAMIVKRAGCRVRKENSVVDGKSVSADVVKLTALRNYG